MRLFIALAAVLGIAACATSPTPSADARQVPASKLTAFQQKPAGEYGTLQVIRDSGHTGSLCAMAIFINGQQAAILEPGEKASFFLTPSSPLVGAAYAGNGVCSMGADRVEREATVKGGELRKYRIYTGGDGHIDVMPTTL